MANHNPKACEKVPYTAYYSNNNWSCQFRCPECGLASRQVVGALEGYEMACDGHKIDVPQKRRTRPIACRQQANLKTIT